VSGGGDRRDSAERDGSDADSTGGTYTLLVEFPAPAEIGVGALGRCRFDAGVYAYTGSALGAGGFSRVDRHRRTARGEHGVRHWHVDHLLGHPDARIDRVVRSVGADVECAVAERFPPGPVDGFGASDCGCESHLAAADEGRSLDEFAARVRDAHEAAVESAGSDASGGDDDATAERAGRVEVVAGE